MSFESWSGYQEEWEELSEPKLFVILNCSKQKFPVIDLRGNSEQELILEEDFEGKDFLIFSCPHCQEVHESYLFMQYC